MSLTKRQINDIKESAPEMRIMLRVLETVKKSGEMPKGLRTKYAMYKNFGLIKYKTKTTKTGHKVYDKIILTKQGKEMLSVIKSIKL